MSKRRKVESAPGSFFAADLDLYDVSASCTEALKSAEKLMTVGEDVVAR